MKVRFTIAHAKSNLDDRIKSVDIVSDLIAGSIKGQAVNARAKSFAFWQQLGAAAVHVRAGRGHHVPFAGGILPIEAHRNVFRWFAQRGIENVG